MLVLGIGGGRISQFQRPSDAPLLANLAAALRRYVCPCWLARSEYLGATTIADLDAGVALGRIHAGDLRLVHAAAPRRTE